MNCDICGGELIEEGIACLNCSLIQIRKLEKELKDLRERYLTFIDKVTNALKRVETILSEGECVDSPKEGNR